MENSLFLMFLPAVIGVSFAGFLVIAVAVFQDGKHEATRAIIVKRGYIYLVSFITLLLVALSVVSIVDLGMRSWAVRKADPTPNFYQDPPPMLFFSSTGAEVKPAGSALTCTDGCSLTEQQKSDIVNWEQNYRDWQIRRTDPKVAASLVTPLSFLIIAGIVFFFHWRLVRRDRERLEEGANLTRSTYFTAMSFIWLVASVFAAGFLLNTILRSAIPGGDSSPRYAEPAAIERTSVESLETCGTQCGLSSETVALATSWKTDYDAWQAEQRDRFNVRNRHNSLAVEFSFLLVVLPLFWLHFRTAWREKKPVPTKVV